MTDLEYFLATYGLNEGQVTFVPYGSRVYGTNNANSDYDYMAIVPSNRRADTGTEFRHGETNIHIYNLIDFQSQLDLHKIHALEAYFMPEGEVAKIFWFTLDLPKLRCSLSEKSSNSWVKAKKKIEVEKDYYFSWIKNSWF